MIDILSRARMASNFEDDCTKTVQVVSMRTRVYAVPVPVPGQ